MLSKKLFLIFLPILTILVAGIIIIFKPQNSFTPGISNSKSALDYWEQDMVGWKAKGTPPNCPEPSEFTSFTNVSKATSVLYPGQMRSVGYEPTAGFRFDGIPNNEITITSPVDGEIIQAARFIVQGDMQYVFDILMPCGILVRFDHLLTLSPKYQELADQLPPAKEGDSRSTSVRPTVKVLKGEVIATGVGISKNNNNFISWTMYDFRQKNKISQNAAWAANHPGLYHYAICPFPYLPKEEQVRIKSLPAADGMSGSKSDFCN